MSNQLRKNVVFYRCTDVQPLKSLLHSSVFLISV